MSIVADSEPDFALLRPDERPAARVHNPDGRGGAVLVCEHASRFIPAALGDLGLDEAAKASHAAWDIGALEVARGLSRRLDAPMVHSCVSRLVYDCNRPPEAPDAMPARSERFDVPGNAELSPQAREARVREVYVPFTDLLSATIEARPVPSALITVHSFTPVYMGRHRPVQIGILHDEDARLADAMLALAGRHTALRVARNDPYGPSDGVTHTLRRHGLSRGLANVMIELRNDLLDSAEACDAMAAMLAGWLTEALGALAPAAGRSPAQEVREAGNMQQRRKTQGNG